MRNVALALTLVSVLWTAGVSEAHGPMPPSVPLRRLLKNVEAYVKAHPNDPNGYYTLGRLNYFAVTAPPKADANPGERPDQALAYHPGDARTLPSLFNGWTSSPNGKNPPARPASFQRTPQEQVAFLQAAVRNLSRAIALRGADKGDGLFELCLACTLEDGAALAKQAGPLPPVAPTPDPTAWRNAATELYLRAYNASERAQANVYSVAYEASDNWLRLVQQRGPTVLERVEIVRVTVARKQMEARPAMVTPIVLSLTPGKQLRDLLDPKRRVTFDLRGDGLKRAHAWLRPDTALLVWDPQRTGTIASGKQLFGSATWWLFWQSGYQALAALDDDRDGRLSGGELSGLALWFDRNQNGVSDPGEVVPLEKTGIASLSTRATGRVGESWESRGGATLRDGTKLTTWDWVTH